ncbi:hypothetical protein [uncultured Pedobacter sp.]|uniref:hypothetical protein n=1 Tax=uncultured Pedobacter sp. TaxID=246139 RepID=UPI0025CE4036|nr:hypothetical protein [uncultured Pedobacter sp.]
MYCQSPKCKRHEIDRHPCRLYPNRSIKFFLADKQWIALEYGQKAGDVSELYIRDDDGKKLEFNSALDAVNKMKAYGYELFSVYMEQIDKDSNRPVYVLKRK